MIDDHPLRVIAAKQLGMVTTAQAREQGFTRDQRHRLVDGRRWERASPRVLRLVGAPSSEAQEALLAVLDAGPHAALVSMSAAAWWAIPGNRLRPLQVGRLRDRTCRPDRFASNHEPTLLPPHHVTVLDGVPTVVPARALFDVAGTRRRGAERRYWVERMGRMVDTAWSKGLVNGRALHRMLDELATRGRPGIRVMRQVLAERGLDYVPPASGTESRFAQILSRAGLPAMRRQVDTGDDEGWIGRVDFRDEALPLIAEVQSERYHTSLTDRRADAARIARLRAAGFVVLEIWDTDIWHRPDTVVAMVRRGRLAARAERAS